MSDSIRSKVDSTIIELRRTQDEDRIILQMHIALTKQYLLNEIRDKVRSELQEMECFLSRAKGEKIARILRHTKKIERDNNCRL